MAAEYLERMGERIRSRREELGLSRADVARLMPGKTNENAIYRWEKGKVRPQDDTLEALAKALEVDVAYFLSPTPVAGTGDLIGALADGTPAGEAQLDRIESMLGELLTRVQRLEDAMPSGADGLEAELEDGGRPPSVRDDDSESDEPEDQAEGQ